MQPENIPYNEAMEAPSRFSRLVDLTMRSGGAAKATPQMVELQVLIIVSVFVNFFRIRFEENEFNHPFPSTCVLVEAPSGSGKNAAMKFLEKQVFSMPFTLMMDQLKACEKTLLAAEAARLHELHEMDDIEDLTKTEANKKQKAYDKEMKAYKANQRRLSMETYDDGSYEGLAMDRAYLASLAYGSLFLKSYEFGDRLEIMKKNVYLFSMYSRLLELIDHDVLGTKSIKAREGSTPGSEGLGTTLYLTLANMDFNTRAKVRNTVLGTMGRRAFLLRETNETIKFKTLVPLEAKEVNSMAAEVTHLMNAVQDRINEMESAGDERLIKMNKKARAWYKAYGVKYREEMNKIYEGDAASSDKDVRLALMQDLDRKILKMASLLAVFNHGDEVFEIRVSDMLEACSLVERSFENAKGFFDMTAYSATNRVVAFLQARIGAWVPAKVLLDEGMFSGINTRSYQGPINEVMMRDVLVAVEDLGYTLDYEVYRRQDRYRLRPKDAGDAYLEKLEGGGTEVAQARSGPFYSFRVGMDPAHKDGYKVSEDMEFMELLLKGEYCYSAIEWKGGVRRQENFLQANLIILDFDEGLALEQAKYDFAGFRALIATTKSHGIEKGGEVCDRFRVILFADRLIDDLEDFRMLMTYLVDKLGADKACKDGGRFYYSNPTGVVHKSSGTALFPVSKVLTMLKAKQAEEEKAKGQYAGPVQKQAKPEGVYTTSSSFKLKVKGGTDWDARAYGRSLPADTSTHPVYCPWHEDKSPSAFISHHEDDRVQITCSVCDKSEFV